MRRAAPRYACGADALLMLRQLQKMPFRCFRRHVAIRRQY